MSHEIDPTNSAVPADALLGFAMSQSGTDETVHPSVLLREVPFDQLVHPDTAETDQLTDETELSDTSPEWVISPDDNEDTDQVDASIAEAQASVAEALEADAERKSKLDYYAGRLAVTGLLAMTAVDFFALDGGNALLLGKMHEFVVENVQASNSVRDVIETSATTAAVFVEAMIMGLPIAYSKKMRGLSDGYEKYLEHNAETFTGARKWMSEKLNMPINYLRSLGSKAKDKGEAIEASDKSPLQKSIGHLLVDAGVVLASASTGAIAAEVSSNPDKQMPLRRVARLSALGATVWMGIAKPIVMVHDAAGRLGKPGAMVQYGMEKLYDGFEYLVAADPFHPDRTPVASGVLLSVIGSLAWSGWKASKFIESDPEAEVVESTVVSPVITQEAA